MFLASVLANVPTCYGEFTGFALFCYCLYFAICRMFQIVSLKIKFMFTRIICSGPNAKQ